MRLYRVTKRLDYSNIICNACQLTDESELVFAFFDEAEAGNRLIFGDFGAIYRDGVASDKLASFAFTGSEASSGENIDKRLANCGSWEALGEKVEIFRGEIFDFAVAKEEIGELFGLGSGSFAVDNLGNFVSKTLLAEASAWVGAVFRENLVEFFWHDKSEELEVIFERFVGLVEPELVEVENTGFFGVEPDGVAFGFAEFAAGSLIDDKRARVTVGFGAFETLDEVNTRGTVAELVGAAELEIDVVSAEKMQKVVALDEGVAELGIRDAGTTFADAFLDELAIEQLSHTESFADFAEEWEILDIFEPIVVIDKLGAFWGMSDADDLLGKSGLVFLDFVEALEIALGGVLWVTNLAGGTTDKIVRSIAVANEACAHH